jgi:Fe-S oxidoreductase
VIPKSRNLVSELLSAMARNLALGGDPLGFRQVYWTGWAQGLGLPREGETFLFTARMYQMLPYVIQTTKLVDKTRSLLSKPALAKLAKAGNLLAGEKVLRRLAAREQEIEKRGRNTLRGIAAALALAGAPPAYLYEKEPYSGVLLHDLGLEEAVRPHAEKVARVFGEAGSPQIIATDPHTVYMLDRIMPGYIPGFKVPVRHYTEILAGETQRLAQAAGRLPMEEVVVHDSCQMARDLGLVSQVREVARALGLKVKEPENSGQDTACCGGPIEFAYSELSDRISRLRAAELSQRGKDVVVTCPICLINLAKHEPEFGIRVWDLGELLNAGLNRPTTD